MKFIYLEGLPGVGKTTIINEIKKRDIANLHIVDEIINDNILEDGKYTQEEFILNDNIKLNKYSDGSILFDRGPISSLSYAQVKMIIDSSDESNDTIKWFNTIRDSLLNNETKAIYLTTFGKNYTVREYNSNSPYGSIENQKLLEEITLYNLNMYCKEVKIINYNKDNMEDVINEIIA